MGMNQLITGIDQYRSHHCNVKAEMKTGKQRIKNQVKLKTQGEREEGKSWNRGF